MTDRVSTAVRGALPAGQALTHVGYGKGKVEKFASTRRILLKDGHVGARYSCTNDPEKVAASEGTIDPWLRTITLFNSDRALVRLHYYATHPMSDYGHVQVLTTTHVPSRGRGP